jgi:superfamily II DNA or RNA helicase
LVSSLPKENVRIVIPEKLIREFPAALRNRGTIYQAQGRVALAVATPGEIRATVRGSSTYEVSIVRPEPYARGRLSCSCPHARDHYVCKHLYAVLLAADAAGVFATELSGVDGRARRDRSAGARDDVAARTETSRGEAAGGVRAPVRGAVREAAESEPAEWQRRLQRVRRQPGSGIAESDDFGELEGLVGGAGGRETGAGGSAALRERLAYRINLDHLRATGVVLVDVTAEGGARGADAQFSDEAWLGSDDPADRELAHRLLGAVPRQVYARAAPPVRRFQIPPSMYATTLRQICETGRCRLVSQPASESDPVTWEGEAAWRVHFAVDAVARGWRLRGWFRRGGTDLAVEDAVLVTEQGLLVTDAGLSTVDARGSWPLVQALRAGGPVVAPKRHLFELAAEVLLMPGAPELVLPEGADLEEGQPEPVPRVEVRQAPLHSYDRNLPARLTFVYDGVAVPASRQSAVVADPERRRLLHRMPERERAARRRLLELGATVRRDWRSGRRELVIPPDRLHALVLALTAEGWQVEADGRRYRTASHTQARVRSGVDWFELDADVAFDDRRATLPAMLAALRAGDSTVRLDDGSEGILPIEWLRRFAAIGGLGSSDAGEGGIRFGHGQAALLDALLATQPDVQLDDTFARLREELNAFEGIAPQEPPDSFRGELRTYQKEALGWMAFLRRLGLGGCLADDMGLGKTVQVLALLEQRRTEGAGMSLVVVPKSLVFNWIAEAARFTPELRVRNYTGTDRRKEPLEPGSCDVVISTYGTLRRDAPQLAAIDFDYVVLDEANAIKNPDSVSAKAARLLNGRHRLALSGTPIENHLGELWSLFEFLNPGMLGSAAAFSTLRPDARNAPADLEERGVLARALRPFLLRRTKEQVAPELPARTEQTLYVDLEGEQRVLYDSLRLHYRNALLGHIDEVGISRARMRILEALLRLRQAACHPGLIDPTRKSAGSAKLRMLVDTLTEVVDEGHRALVFSQFTSFLDLVRDRLDRAGIRYEYLDGRTRDRQARVERFQAPDGLPVFLISLRAGGHGLNLTAADYVFMLDPWWNPAVEAQAIDRTHRIGQTKPVVAMRLIARDTVEEKVVELQQTKRELADAILGENAGVIAGITREDLELLLG